MAPLESLVSSLTTSHLVSVPVNCVVHDAHFTAEQRTSTSYILADNVFKAIVDRDSSSIVEICGSPCAQFFRTSKRTSPWYLTNRSISMSAARLRLIPYLVCNMPG